MLPAVIFGLTFQQPYATAIIDGPKRIENRKVPPTGMSKAATFPFWILVHAGKEFYDGIDQDRLRELWPDCPAFSSMPTGAILGAVEVLGAYEYDAADCPAHIKNDPWAFGFSCWELGRVVRFPTPIPAKGALGLWKPTKEVLTVFEMHYTPQPSKGEPVTKKAEPKPKGRKTKQEPELPLDQKILLFARTRNYPDSMAMTILPFFQTNIAAAQATISACSDKLPIAVALEFAQEDYRLTGHFADHIQHLRKQEEMLKGVLTYHVGGGKPFPLETTPPEASTLPPVEEGIADVSVTAPSAQETPPAPAEDVDPPDVVVVQRSTQYMNVPLSQEQWEASAIELANMDPLIAETEARHKEIRAELKDEMDRLKMRRSILSDEVKTHKGSREVDVRVEARWKTGEHVTIVEATGEEIARKPISAEERQTLLWSLKPTESPANPPNEDEEDDDTDE